MFPRAKRFFIEDSKCKSSDEFSHDAFEEWAETKNLTKTQRRKRNSTNGHNSDESSPVKRSKSDPRRSVEIVDVRDRSVRANGLPELPRRPLDRHLVVYRFAPLPLADSSLPDETRTVGTHKSESGVAGFIAKPHGSDKNYVTTELRERAWRALVNAYNHYGHPCFIIAANHPMAKWNAHLFSPQQNRDWWLLTKRVDLKSLAMISCYQCDECGSNLNKHEWDGVQCKCPSH